MVLLPSNFKDLKLDPEVEAVVSFEDVITKKIHSATPRIGGSRGLTLPGDGMTPTLHEQNRP